MLRRGFVDDERTAQMCEDGGLNLSVIPIVVLRRPHGVVASLAYIILHPAVRRQESQQSQSSNLAAYL